MPKGQMKDLTYDLPKGQTYEMTPQETHVISGRKVFVSHCHLGIKFYKYESINMRPDQWIFLLTSSNFCFQLKGKKPKLI